DPAHSVALPKAMAALQQLSKLPNTSVALVSGRSLESLQEVSKASKDFYLVGSHGVEFLSALTAKSSSKPDDAKLQELHNPISQISNGIGGTWVEQKPYSVGSHTRQASQVASKSACDLIKIMAQQFFQLPEFCTETKF